jgi:hypothetical protein
MLDGDLSKLSATGRIAWYRARCEAAQLDPRAQPFQYLTLNGKLVLYATKACTDQLTGIHRLSVEIVSRDLDRDSGIYTVQARVTFPDGRKVDDIGALPVGGLKGENLSNALMKTATKAKRRAVLSACGLGMLDETEAEAIHGAARVVVDDAGEVVGQIEPPAPTQRPVPQNNSGFGRGQHASPEQIDDWTKTIAEAVRRINARWADRWQARNGDQPDVRVKDLMHPFGASGHLLKWAVATERLDPVIVPGDIRPRERDSYVAIVYARKAERKALWAELEEYVAKEEAMATEALYRKHPEMVPAEEQGQDEGGGEWNDEAEEIMSSEGGRSDG